MNNKISQPNHLYIKYFIPFLFLYFVIQLVLRVFISPSLELDESEQMLLTQQFAWGYNSQPPLYTWIQMIFFEIFDRNIFAIAFMKNILLFLSYFFLYKSTKLITQDTLLSSIAAASMILLPQISWESQRDLTHSVLLTTIASATFYLTMRIKYSVSRVHIGNYILLGVLISAGMLAKYSFAIFIFALAAVSLFDHTLRRFIFSKKIIITFFMIGFTYAFHAVWLFEHLDLATNSTLEKLVIEDGSMTSLIGITALFKAIILFLMPYLLIIFLIFRKAISFKKEHFLFYFFILVTITLVLFVLYTGTTNIKDRWMQPYFFLMVAYIASQMDIDKLDFSKVTLYFKIVYFFMLLILVALFIRVYVPDTIKKYYRLNYPFESVAQQIKAENFSPDFIIAENKLIGGNFKLNFPKSVVAADNFQIESPNKPKKILIVWEKNFPTFAKQYQDLISKKKTFSAKYLYSDKKTYVLNVIMIEF